MVTVPGQPRVLGAGPVATVYSGLHDGLPVALKVFPTKFDRRTLTAVKRECTRLASVPETPSILPVQGIDPLPDGRHALRMELCTQSLATLVRQTGPLPPGDGVVLGYALARALAAAHSVGVVHGGVNPNNVLFRESGEPVLADFGVVLRHAFARDPLHAIEFQAPETAREQILDERTDLYGLGATLHFALTGQVPHPAGQLGEPPLARVERVLRAPVPAIHRPGVPIGLSTVIARMLAADPANRPTDAAVVAGQLAGMLAPQPDPPAPPTPPPPEPGWADSPDPAPPAADPVRRRLILGGAALTLLLIVALVLVLVLRNEPDELTTTPRTPPAPPTTSQPNPAAAVQLELSEPVDHGDHVELNWKGAPNLDFGVVVAADGEPTRALDAGRGHTYRLSIDPNRKYCFWITATDRQRIYDSEPKSLHGADCRR